ncbi:MAG: hypothetical protein K2Y25_06635 [Pseudomonadaceae bacterium]|jgi:hypothetical protein|nr:hypothetical protein [Pseudomonadaceae bacterium]
MKLTRRLLWPLAILLLVISQTLRAGDLFYLGEKIPDVQKPWDSSNYQQMISALQKLDKTQANALPRRSGEFTGPIYLRMINPENFKPQLNIYAPLELRQNEAREQLFQLKELMRLYFDFDAKLQPYGAEALGLMTYSMQQQAVLFTLTTEFWTTLSPTERSNPVRLKGLSETKAAAAMLTSSALDYLELSKQFSQEDLVLYGAELGKQLPDLFVHLPANIRPQLLARIDSLSRQHPYAPVRKSLSEVLPVLLVIQADVEQQQAQPLKNPPPKATKLDLSAPKEPTL